MDSMNSGFVVAIDDDLQILAYLRELLSLKGYKVVTFNRPDQALEFLNSSRPELILLDVSIPEIDGFEVFRRIKANSELSIVPVIFITSGVEFNLKIEALNLGAVDYITKPFHRQELLARVDTHLRFFRLTELVKSQAVELAETRILKELNLELVKKNKDFVDLNEKYLKINEELNLRNNELELAKNKAEEREEDYKIALEDLNKAQSIAKIGSWKWFLQENRFEFSPGLYNINGIEGASSDLEIKEKFYKLIHPDDRTKAQQFFNSGINKSTKEPIEYRIILPDGSIKTLWAETGELVYDSNSNPYLLSGIVQDITERKEIERKLHESEEQYKLAFQTSTDAIAIAKLNGEYIDVNEGFLKLLGYSKEEVLGKTSDELRIWEFPFERQSFVDRLLEEKNIENLEINNRRKDGNLITILLSSNIITLNGKPHILTISRDISERKRFEDTLKEKEEKYRFLAENIQDVIWIIDAETFKFTYLSPSVEKLRGYTVDEIMELSVLDAVTAKSREYLENVFPQRLIEYQTSKKEVVFVDEIEQPCKNGTTIWTEVVTYVRKNSQGRIEILGSSRNISDRKKSEIALKESEDKFSKAFYSSPACMILAYISTAEIIDVNNQVLEILEYERSEIVGHTTIELNLWIDLGQRIEYLQKVINNIAVDNEDVQFRAKSGKILYTRYSAQKIRLGDEDCILAVFVDITERKNMEIELLKAKELAEENEKRVSSMFSTANTGFVVIAPNGNLIEWNDTFIKYFGYLDDEFSDFTLNDITHPDDIPLSIRYLEDVNSGAIENFRIEKRFIRKDGSIFWADWFASPLKKDNKTYALLGVVNDITERKNTEFELIKAKEKAEESDQLKSAFLQNMSHEIRTPMNAIIGFSGMMIKGELSEDKRKSYSSIIINSSKQLLSIVTDILTISSLETKQEKLNLEPVCINSLIVELLSIFRPQAGSQNISLYAKQYFSDKQSEVYTDRTKITQILTNLLTNALKFTQEGFIEFGYSYKNAQIEFFVKDTGIGIKPEQQDKIFERFRQADISINKKYGGTGLGLSISKGFTELLGGKIWVESVVEKGATFYFTIPYTPVDNNELEIDLSQTSKNKLTIVIAEDEEYNYLLIEELLQDLDIRIIHTKNGFETVELCKKDMDIDLILMDIKMPIMDGHKAAEIIKTFKPDLKIIAQSAYALEHEIEKFRGVFDGYLTKPINSEELIKTIDYYLQLKA